MFDVGQTASCGLNKCLPMFPRPYDPWIYYAWFHFITHVWHMSGLLYYLVHVKYLQEHQPSVGKEFWTCHSKKNHSIFLWNSGGIGLPPRVIWYVDCCPAQHHSWPADISEYDIWASDCSELVSVNCRQPLSIYKISCIMIQFFAHVR